MQHHARVQHKSRKRASVDECDLCSSKHSTTRFVVLYDDVGLELSGRIPGTIDYSSGAVTTATSTSRSASRSGHSAFNIRSVHTGESTLLIVPTLPRRNAWTISPRPLYRPLLSRLMPRRANRPDINMTGQN